MKSKVEIDTNIDPETFSVEAKLLLKTLEDANCETWFVGGCVRDSLLKRQISDVDLTTRANWQKVKEVCEDAGFSVRETGTKHGTVTVIVNTTPFEVTTFRTEGAYTDARHPDAVEFCDKIEDDLSRRDFTINAMAYHPKHGLLDPHDGLRDMKRGIIRAVGNPRKRFQEDALRILRACRFSSTLGFEIEHYTYLGMLEHKSYLVGLTAERIVAEMDKLLLGEHVHDALINCVDALAPIIPELLTCKNFNQNTPYHIYDVLEHTAYVVQNTQPVRLNRWVALFHDIGKPPAYFQRDDCIGHFYGHPRISVQIARATMQRLGFSPAFAQKVLTLVRIHDDLIDDNPRAVKRALARLGGDVDMFRTLCDIKRADALSQAPQCHGKVELAQSLRETLDEVIASNEAFSQRQLEINGNDVMALGLPAGPAVGAALNAALTAVIDGTVANNKEELIEFVKSHI